MIANSRIWTLGTALACWIAPGAPSQALVFSTSADVAASPAPVLEEELDRFDPAGRSPCLTRGMLGLLVGDANADGIFNDHPIDLDAAHASGLPEPGSHFLSTTSDFDLVGGMQIKDGDVFHFTGTGAVVDLPESFFEAVTGTSGVDVDGFAIAPNGDLYFSFAEDEATTIPALIAQNGGFATLDEQCVFKFAGGAAAATIHLTQSAVVAVFNAAFGASATTVVDVDGIELDPSNPGELLLTSLSTASAFRGKVITTAGGGLPFAIGGVPVEPATLGLPATTSLDALALATSAPAPVVTCVPEIVSAASPGTALIESRGWSPGTPVQFVATDAVLPQPVFLAYPAHAGYNASPLDPANPLFAISFTISAWIVPADASGTAALTFATVGLPVGINAAVQTVDLATGTISTPASIAFGP
jgi:hypothetical protein